MTWDPESGRLKIIWDGTLLDVQADFEELVTARRRLWFWPFSKERRAAYVLAQKNLDSSLERLKIDRQAYYQHRRTLT